MAWYNWTNPLLSVYLLASTIFLSTEVQACISMGKFLPLPLNNAPWNQWQHFEHSIITTSVISGIWQRQHFSMSSLLMTPVVFQNSRKGGWHSFHKALVEIYLHLLLIQKALSRLQPIASSALFADHGSIAYCISITFLLVFMLK